MDKCSRIFSRFFKKGKVGEPDYGLTILTNAKVADMTLEKVQAFTEVEYMDEANDKAILDKEKKNPAEEFDDSAIMSVINQYWHKYDEDGSGELDKDETKKFVQEAIGGMGGADEFTSEAFDAIFETFDKDGSGTIEKDEMIEFLR